MATYTLCPLRRVFALVERSLNRPNYAGSSDVNRLRLGRVVDILCLQFGLIQILRVLNNKIGVLRGRSREVIVTIENDVVPEGLECEPVFTANDRTKVRH